MTRIIDLWRAIDAEARLVSGSDERLTGAVRSAVRTRAAAPHLPPATERAVLIVDAALTRGPRLDDFVRVLREAELDPVALLLAGEGERPAIERASDPLPVLASRLGVAQLHERANAYLADPGVVLEHFTTQLRLAAAEAALADPDPAAPAGLVAARLRRGVAVSTGGKLRSLHPRSAGTALAARFAAMHARLLASSSAGRDVTLSRRHDRLWILERRVRPDASVWLFDDLPLAEVDAAGADALTFTLRALLRRPATDARAPTARPGRASAPPDGRLAPDETLRATLVAVARANGRVAPAARSLGVHRNTVLYRLRRAAAELGLDPRRAEDAIRILTDADG
jgi:PucR C-terminal helix-turn-helix domain